MLDQALVEAIAVELGTHPGFIEKDWQVIKALGLLAELDHGDATPVFSGGTALSKGWQVISRFSEDIDFKVAMPVNASRKQWSEYRKRVIATLEAGGFVLSGQPLVADGSRFFQANFEYQTLFPVGPGQRPHLRVEMRFEAPALPALDRPLQSFVSQAQQALPEVAAFPCVDPLETAADKLSALAWRACTRDRAAADDDPAVVRHMHDLAALEPLITDDPVFARIVHANVLTDSSRGGGLAPADPRERFQEMLERISTDPLWFAEYEQFVRQVSYANPEDAISFQDALGTLERLVRRYEATLPSMTTSR